MRKAIALTRVSTEGQAEEGREGLASQRRAIERTAELHALEIVGTLELAGVSGAKVMQDQRFQELLVRIEDPEIAGVIVAASDRLMRPESLADYAILEAFRTTNTLLYTPNGPRDLTKDRLLQVIETELSHLERTRIRERTQRAKNEHRLKGRHVAGPISLPFAVDYDKPTATWSYKPAEGAIVREVYRRVLGGARNFAAVGRAVGISPTLVRKILLQPLYAGFRLLDASGRMTPDGTPQVVFDSPLVSATEWEAVRPIVFSRRPSPRGRGPGVYRGFLTCAHCGDPLTMHRERRGAWSYRCRASVRGAGGVQISHTVVDAAADEAVGKTLASSEVIAAALESIATPEPVADLGKDQEKELAVLRSERERVMTGYERGLRTLEDAERRVGEIEIRMRALAALAAPSPPEDLSEAAHSIASTFAEWEFLNTRAKRAILSASVDWIRVEKPGRAQAAVEAISLRVPTDGAPTTPSGPHRGKRLEEARERSRRTGPRPGRHRRGARRAGASEAAGK